uniref:Uncharacterized protein n=1 Tax=Leersia perrieri TaxID=77586 RepID=A0A0D9XXX3_9ORYZ
MGSHERYRYRLFTATANNPAGMASVVSAVTTSKSSSDVIPVCTCLLRITLLLLTIAAVV